MTLPSAAWPAAEWLPPWVRRDQVGPPHSRKLRRRYPRDGILSASAPDPADVQTWLGLCAPELGKSHTAVILRGVDLLPSWVAEQMRELVRRSCATSASPFTITAERFDDIPSTLADLVDIVVSVPPLRDRSDDILPLANHVAARMRGRKLTFTTAASRALSAYDWPGNDVSELSRVVTDAAGRADTIDVAHLPVQIMAGRTRKLSRIEAFECGEIVRVLSAHDLTKAQVATELGMSRATLYRKISQYGIEVVRD